MRISETEWIPATQHQTWDALIDPDVLQKCIPGCVEVSRTSPTEYHVTLHTKVAGIEASYDGEILMSDVNAPDGCTLAFEGKGAAAGLAIGKAQVNMVQKEQGTRLTYTVAAMAGGKLAQCGDRALMGAAQKIIAKFMVSFTEHMNRVAPTVYVPPPPTPTASSRYPILSWTIPIAIVIALAGYHTFFK